MSYLNFEYDLQAEIKRDSVRLRNLEIERRMRLSETLNGGRKIQPRKIGLKMIGIRELLIGDMAVGLENVGFENC